MARVHSIQLHEVPPGPDEYTSKQEALAAQPEKVVVDAVFSTQRSVEDAAFRVNANKRRDWPASHYYAAWKFNPKAFVSGKDNEDTPKEAGGWELLIGFREHMPESWRAVVEAPGSRKRRKRKELSEAPAAQQQDDQEEQEYSDVA